MVLEAMAGSPPKNILFSLLSNLSGPRGIFAPRTVKGRLGRTLGSIGVDVNLEWLLRNAPVPAVACTQQPPLVGAVGVSIDFGAAARLALEPRGGAVAHDSRAVVKDNVGVSWSRHVSTRVAIRVCVASPVDKCRRRATGAARAPVRRGWRGGAHEGRAETWRRGRMKRRRLARRRKGHGSRRGRQKVMSAQSWPTSAVRCEERVSRADGLGVEALLRCACQKLSELGLEARASVRSTSATQVMPAVTRYPVRVGG